MTVQAFIQYDSDAPLVAASIVLPPFYHFRSHVLAGTDYAHGRGACAAAVAPVEKWLCIVALFAVVFLGALDMACTGQLLHATVVDPVLFVTLDLDT